MAPDKTATDGELNTLGDLLAAIPHLLQSRGDRTAPQIKLEFGKQKTVARHLARFLRRTVSETPIRSVLGQEEKFLRYLKQRKLKDDVIARHKYASRRLLHYARDLGWSPESFEIENDWRFLSEGNVKCISSLIEHVTTNRIPPAEFSEEHLRAWKQDLKDGGRAPSTIDQAEYYFRSFIRKNGYESRLPLLDFSSRRRESFRLPRKEMDPALAAEIQDLESWLKQGAVQISESWQERIICFFERLCGYAVRHRKFKNLVSLDRLLTKKFLRDYAHWLAGSCGYPHGTIHTMLSGLSTILRWHPRFEQNNWGWLMGIAAEIPAEPKSQQEARRDARKADYRKLVTIPENLRQKRLASKECSPKEMAWLAHDHAVMAALVLAVWPVDFILSAKIDGSEPNLFRSPIDPAEQGAMTDWAAQAIRKDPQTPLWQFSFARQGPRSCHASGLVPSRALGVLEEYIEEHRPLLVCGNDSGSLFLSRRGSPIQKCALHNAVTRLTEEFLGTPVSPSSIQKSFADWFLDLRPGDYVHLANILWLRYESVRAFYDPDFRRNWRYFREQRQS